MTAATGGALEIACHLNVFVGSPADPTVPAALARIAAAGCARVVLPPLVDPDLDRDTLGRMIADAGLGVIGFASLRAGSDVSSPDADERSRGRDALTRALDNALAVGASQLTGVPYAAYGRPEPIDAEGLRRSAEIVGAFAEEAHAAGVAVTFEVLNRYETAALSTVREALAYRALTGSTHLGIHLDSFHLTIEEPDPAAAITAALPHLGYLEFGQSGRGGLTGGSVDVPGILSAALRGGYRGCVGFEAFSRSVLGDAVSDRLRIWSDPYLDPDTLVQDAVALLTQAALEAADR